MDSTNKQNLERLNQLYFETIDNINKHTKEMMKLTGKLGYVRRCMEAEFAQLQGVVVRQQKIRDKTEKTK